MWKSTQCISLPDAALFLSISAPVDLLALKRRVSGRGNYTRRRKIADNALNLMLAINILPTAIVSLSFIFFYTSLLSLAICMVNHLEQVFNYLNSADYGQKFANRREHDAQCLDVSVRQILKYAHNLHVRIIK